MRSLHIHEALAHTPTGSVLPSEETSHLEAPLERLMGRAAARRLLTRAGVVGATRMPATELAMVAEVSLKIAERVVAARDFGQSLVPFPKGRVTNSQEAIGRLPVGFARSETEILLGLALTVQMTVKATVVFAKGGDSSASVRPRDVFVPLVRLAASAFVLAHCHPGGDPTPSAEDVELTNRLARAAVLLGMDLIDHVIVATGGTFSFRDHDLLPTKEEMAPF